MNCVKWPCGADQHPAHAGLILSLAFNGAKIGADALFGSLARLAPVAQISDETGVAYRFAPETRGGGAGPGVHSVRRAAAAGGALASDIGSSEYWGAYEAEE